MIRIRHAEGASTVHTEPGMTLEDLRALIFSQTNIAPEDQERTFPLRLQHVLVLFLCSSFSDALGPSLPRTVAFL